MSQIDGIPELPIKPIKGEIIRLERDGNDLQNRVGFSGFNVGRKPDGSVWAGTYEWDRGFNRDITEEGRNHIMNGVTSYIPSLASLKHHQDHCVPPTSCQRRLTDRRRFQRRRRPLLRQRCRQKRHTAITLDGRLDH